MHLAKKCSKIFLTVALAVAFAVPAWAAEVKTQYFSLALPEGWTQPQPVQNANGTSLAIFQNKKDGSAVTITVVSNGMSAKDAATQTIANMKAGGLKATDPVEKNGIYESSFSQGQGKGVSYFGSNGKEFAVTTIIGPNTETGKALLKNLKPTDSKLFPKF